MVLRLLFLQGENIETIGRTYGVHRATVGRWIAAARAEVVAAVRAELGARFGLAGGDCDSIAFTLHGRLSVSLTNLL
jgi:RNA polymerase sigma-70 factor (ECF subfamily)